MIFAKSASESLPEGRSILAACLVLRLRVDQPGVAVHDEREDVAVLPRLLHLVVVVVELLEQWLERTDIFCSAWAKLINACLGWPAEVRGCEYSELAAIIHQNYLVKLVIIVVINSDHLTPSLPPPPFLFRSAEDAFLLPPRLPNALIFPSQKLCKKKDLR